MQQQEQMASLSVASPASPFSPELSSHQQSCTPNTGNGGNFYNRNAYTPKRLYQNGVIVNSICPKGWQIPGIDSETNKSYFNISTTIYNNPNTSDLPLRSLPISLIRSRRFYDGEIDQKGYGYYWTNKKLTELDLVASYGFRIDSSTLTSIAGNSLAYAGVPLRCVAR